MLPMLHLVRKSETQMPVSNRMTEIINTLTDGIELKIKNIE